MADGDEPRVQMAARKDVENAQNTSDSSEIRGNLAEEVAKPRKENDSTLIKGPLDGKFRWKDADKKIAICTVCEKEMKYHHSISSLRYHFEHKHPFNKTANDGEKQGKKKVTQLKLFSYTSRDVSNAKKEELTRQMALWVAKSSRPISIVEDPEFGNLMKQALDNPNFTCPSRMTISRRIDNLYEVTRASVESKLAKSEYVAVTADHWTSVSNENYLGVTSHHINEDWELVSNVLGVFNSSTSQTAANIAEELRGICEEWKIIEKLCSVGSDNARNMVNAVGLLPSYVQHLPCFAHTLQLAVGKGIKECGIDNILAKCRRIVGHIKHSPKNFAELKALQTQFDEQQEALVSATNII